MNTLPAGFWVSFLFCLVLLPLSGAETRTLSSEIFYLGPPGVPEWSHFAGREPHGQRLDLPFQSDPNGREATLLIHQEDVKFPWKVMLNGKALGDLIRREVPLVSRFSIPAKALQTGENLLSIVPSGNEDDILIGSITLDSRPFAEATGGTPLSIKVTDRQSGNPLPCRVTVADENDVLVPLYTAPERTLPVGKGVIPTEAGQTLAVRTGVIYTPDGNASFGILPGIYTIYASRGFEYSVSSQRVIIEGRRPQLISLEIERSVSTEGWVAADCHIHTLTYSGHGDATIDEGMVTIAGEGIEFAVATDHNHHTDYMAPARRMGVNPHFTSVVGNEVTSKVGHFNAFPVRSASALPDHKLTAWPELIQSIRTHTGAKVIVLNHPRNFHGGFSPMIPEYFRQVTGENLRGDGFGFEAMEIVTSAALQSDLMDPIRDWFGLLNHGYRVTGVGSSDTHYVSRMILGQGRSYVRSDDSDPENLDTNEIVRGYREGRISVSMGLLVDISVNGQFGIGDLATDPGDEMTIAIDTVGPDWVGNSRESPFETQLFFNGYQVGQATRPGIEPLAFRFNGTQVDYSLNQGRGALEAKNMRNTEGYPQHDFWIVAVATGPGVRTPFWAIPRPYQPTSKVWTPQVIGVTNPVWVDADGDGHFTSPRGYAERLVERFGKEQFGPLLEGLEDFDQAVSAQVASLLHAQGVDLLAADFRKALRTAPDSAREGIQAFVETLR